MRIRVQRQSYGLLMLLLSSGAFCILLLRTPGRDTLADTYPRGSPFPDERVPRDSELSCPPAPDPPPCPAAAPCLTSNASVAPPTRERQQLLGEALDRLGPTDKSRVFYSTDPPIPAWHERWLARAGTSNVPCRQRGWEYRDSKARLIDLFLLNNEIDPLEVRLNELDPVVDLFVIVESLRTFTGNEKPSTFDQHVANDPRFARFLPKIVHLKLEKLEGTTNMDREAYQRNALTERGLEAAKARPGDLFIMGDLDEIPRGSVLNMMKTCTGWERAAGPTCISMRLFYYGYEYRWANRDWNFPHVAVHPTNMTAQQIRDTDCKWDVAFTNAGWHCSWCFPEVEQFSEKLEAYRHREDFKSVDRFKDRLYVLDSVVGGLDFTDRAFQKYDNLRSAAGGSEELMDMPSWLAIERPPHLAYLWDRLPWAVSKGWKEPGPDEK
ncbi:glycosyltransferase family 17-domain-containing protein [Hyaloraphidium curvatum]|nr:glycosyltransferase family 17-domain-containing protein [Hyaloraphidium curvatum]